jgi:hypothetical protein
MMRCKLIRRPAWAIVWVSAEEIRVFVALVHRKIKKIIKQSRILITSDKCAVLDNNRVVFGNNRAKYLFRRSLLSCP